MQWMHPLFRPKFRWNVQLKCTPVGAHNMLTGICHCQSLGDKIINALLWRHPGALTVHVSLPYNTYAPVICNHCSPNYGEGRELWLFSFQFPTMSPIPKGQTGGQNFALCPAFHNRKSPWGKDPNIIFPGGGGANVTNDWCIKQQGCPLQHDEFLL